MLFVFFVVLASASTNILFKIFQRIGVNPIQAILFNYVVATSLSLMVSPIRYPFGEIFSHGWFYYGIFLGTAFYISMYLYSISTRHLGVGVTTLIAQMSLILPTIASVIIFGEQLTTQSTVAIGLILIGLYFILYNKIKNGEERNFSIWLIFVLPLLVFIFSGSTDIALKVAQSNFIHNANDNGCFIATVYVTSLTISLIVYLSSNKIKSIKLTPKTVIWGCVMGIFSTLNSMSILKALAVLPASTIFPIVNTGVVVLSVLVGILAFREHYTTRKIIGIVIALVAILLLC